MQTFTLDTRTLAVVLIAVSVLISLLMLLLWRTRKTYSGFGLWAASTALHTTGFFLFSLRDILPDYVTILLSNLLLLGATVCIFEGIRRFHGDHAQWTFNIAALAVIMAILAYFTYVNNRLETRIIIYSIFAAAMYFRCAFELLLGTSEELRSTSWFTSTLLTLYALILTARALISHVTPEIHSIFMTNELQTVFYLSSLLLGLTWTLSFVLLNSERMELELRKAQVELQHLARTDFLTGVSNNRHFSEVCESEFQRARRLNHPLTVCMIDVDNFKQINDLHGHATGDQILTTVASVCRKNLRSMDSFGRLGGDEFAALLPETGLDSGLNIAERLRPSVEQIDFQIAAATLRITISLGVSTLQPQDQQIETVLNRADAALYKAKQGGRNRLCTS